MLETKVQRGFNKLAFILINNLKIKPEYDLEKSKVFLLYVQQSSWSLSFLIGVRCIVLELYTLICREVCKFNYEPFHNMLT